MEEKSGSPLVSVIMPAYNAESYIEQAIRSVLNQTVSDLELIVIDDTSTDRTRDIIRAIAHEDRRVRPFFNEKNLGVAKTRNRGLELCHGRYVALLDSDDYWKAQMLERMVARAEETGADIIYCSYELVDEAGKKVCNDFIVPPQTTFRESIVRSVITCSTVLVTGELAKTNRFPTDMYHEDIAMWFRILKDGASACGVTEVLAAYRQHSGSRSSDKLVSACRRWPIYRKHLQMSVPETISVLVRYAFYGLKKFKRI